MNTYVILLELALAGVLVVAAYGKATDRSGSIKAMREFGVPDRMARPLGLTLPWIEAAIGLGLVFDATARWAAIAALVLFGAFIGGIWWQIAHNRAPECHCFGVIHSEPAGWPAIRRNAVFAAIAALIAWHGGIGIGTWLEDQSDGEQLMTLLFAAVILLAVVVWKRSGELIASQQSMKDLLALRPVGAEVAEPVVESPTHATTFQDFSIPAANDGQFIGRELLNRNLPVLLVFTDPGCGPCSALMPELAEWSRRFSDLVTIAHVGSGNFADNERKFEHYGITDWGVQEWPEVSKLYSVIATPTAVLIQPDGSIPGANLNGREEIRTGIATLIDPGSSLPSLTDHTVPVHGTDEPSPFAVADATTLIGNTVSNLPLPRLGGGLASLNQMAEGEFLAIFWRTGCPFCAGMVDDLKELEADLQTVGYPVVLVTSDAENEAGTEGLGFPTLIDEVHAYHGPRFGHPGTPVGFVITEEGKIGSAGISGAEAVLAFLDSKVEHIQPQEITLGSEPVSAI